MKQGATYEGRLDMQLDLDLEKLAHIKNAAIHAQAFQIHGRGLTGNNTLDLFTTSGIEAYPSTKLYEAWYEQKFNDGKIFVRIGQLAADTEFFISQTATLFVNSSYGFPAILAAGLPNGGPAYPLATPGARFKIVPNDNVTILAAVFNGDPAGPFIPGQNAFIAQKRDYSGTNFRLQDAPLVFTEGQFTYNQEKDAKGLPGTIKIGYVHHFGAFQQLDVPAGVYDMRRGNDFAYAIIDQTIYRKPRHGRPGRLGLRARLGRPQRQEPARSLRRRRRLLQRPDPRPPRRHGRHQRRLHAHLARRLVPGPDFGRRAADPRLQRADRGGPTSMWWRRASRCSRTFST